MNKQLIRLLNPTESLKQYLPIIIEGFVNFYGEEKRESIIKKINNINLVCTINPDNLATKIRMIKENISNDLLNQLSDNLNVLEPEKKEFIFKYFGSNNLDNITLMPINNYFKYKKLYDLGIDGRKEIKLNENVGFFSKYISGITKENFEEVSKTPEFLRKVEILKQRVGNIIDVDYYLNETDLYEYEYAKKQAVKYLSITYKDVTYENISDLTSQGMFNSLDIIKNEFDKIYSIYKNETKEIEPFQKYCECCKILQNKLNEKYYTQFVTKYSNLINKKDLEEFTTGKSSFNLYINKVFGSSLSVPGIVDDFSKESEDYLILDNEYKKNLIISNRIKYYKLNGIDLGENYNLYKGNEECQKITPSFELVENIQKFRDKSNSLLQREFYSLLEEYQKNKEMLESQQLLLKNDDYNPDIIANNTTFISPNVKIIDGKKVVFPLVNIGLNLVDGYTDKNIIHELNHVYELALLEEKGDNSFVCGWDYIDSSLDKSDSQEESENINQDRRGYELFNEAINEIIAQKIAGNINESGINIFSLPNEAKTKGGTTYDETIFLIKDFYDTFEKDIIESRSNGNINHILEVTGKENFEQMNDLVNAFSKRFEGNKFYNLIDDLKSNTESINTKDYQSLVSKKDEVIIKMISHKNIITSENNKIN